MHGADGVWSEVSTGVNKGVRRKACCELRRRVDLNPSSVERPDLLVQLAAECVQEVTDILAVIRRTMRATFRSDPEAGTRDVSTTGQALRLVRRAEVQLKSPTLEVEVAGMS